MKFKFQYDEPLGLPRGSVRALLALVLTVGFVIYLVVNNTINEVYLGIMSMVIGNYFGSRASETQGREPDRALPDAE